ncbi:putative phosphoenolpyruvate carboxylase [Helianthus anomalus]
MVQGEVIEQSFSEEHLCFRTLQRFCAATLEHAGLFLFYDACFLLDLFIDDRCEILFHYLT